ncbi:MULTISPECIES: DUF6708 domain-containing protein [Pseudomonas]|uniref:DUF6708 domain-containing protein n=1 Tax=Pseudomonas TaxID=286 RepID=UPI000A41BF94|nr:MULTISPECIES: DUF6708 domain-containing protein [Pseudomonas]AZD83101.1 hypothetical protein C4K14_0246 [Pseudomonas chlororaphis subsp. aureofaciens]AZD89689.1 hypothetical protein C4K13_0241 [Pseudomonas chlororaphis subsp. aureofaciens]AZD96140.1 hypothetical protein C4K12_0243 [Pseudomonas chlororaphis subsp. aureofaciens]WDG48614.1 hypothetical protein PUP58_02220 [Pseudomonas chlororaphis]WDG60763.1 hypothetical protein PUP52_02220 [Pseudomonas chlororaphis]
MFRNLFKRYNKTAAAEPAPDIRSQRPSAGEIRTKGLNETLFLSPLPVYTGQAQVSRRNFSEMNDTFLELGGNNWGMVEQGKILASGIWLLLFFAFIAPILIIMYGVLVYPENFPTPLKDLKMAVQTFSGYALLGILPVGAYVYGMLSSVYAAAKTYPVRFNRQRREVCYVDSKTHRVLIVPWENVVAWVSNTQGVTSYGATRQYTFGMGLEDEEQDKVQFVLLPQSSDAHALGMWTSIRNYMEDGQLVDTPNPMLKALGLIPTGDRLKPYEGLHTFEIEREDARAMGSLDDGGEDLTPEQREHYGYSKRSPWPLRRWYIWRVLSFWKMPYLLAEWSHRKGRPTLPEQVQTWSQPLPPEQWAKPSTALVKANQIVKTAMDKKGATFVEACKTAGLH